MYSRILIATDGSEVAQKAVQHGIQLAKSIGANVVLVTVTELWSAVDVADEVELGQFDAIRLYEDEAYRSAEAILTRSSDLAASLGVASETRHVKDRKPAEGILDTAELEECELIVMASHGRRGIQRMLMGSQTLEVMTLSKIPVLVVR